MEKTRNHSATSLKACQANAAIVRMARATSDEERSREMVVSGYVPTRHVAESLGKLSDSGRVHGDLTEKLKAARVPYLAYGHGAKRCLPTEEERKAIWKINLTRYVLNFGHPLHPSVVVTFTPATEVRVPFSLDLDQPTEPQVVMTCNAARDLLAERGGRLDGTSPLVVVLPGLTEGAALLLAELHGRLGYFPRVVQLRKTEDGTFRLAGTLDLEKVRQAARGRR